ncbi:MAG: 30S ribosomal protein S7 [Deltaproteobacteria bacterium]|nr:30S ribosomal protein S7 [Deltaproteobacteria bacterium]
MPRKKRVSLKRDIEADLKFHDKIISKLINRLMWQGQKKKAQTIVYEAFEIVKQKKGQEPLELFKKAMENIKPVMEVRSRRVGGANYQVPVEVRPERKLSLGLKWLVDACRSRGEKTMSERLAVEIMEASENRGAAMKKKEDTHKMAEANRAFSHYRW